MGLSNGVTVRDFVISGSGDTHDGIDAGLLVAGDDNKIKGNKMVDVLFGIHIKTGNRNHIAGKFTSSVKTFQWRCEAMRCAYGNSRHNRIENNQFEHRRSDPTRQLARQPHLEQPVQ